ncbi:MAG TPA: TolC family protein, partial [Candidatus Cybelea sp.]|nr:TolC family protein [Candidatus Cybelea sp.]
GQRSSGRTVKSYPRNQPYRTPQNLSSGIDSLSRPIVGGFIVFSVRTGRKRRHFSDLTYQLDLEAAGATQPIFQGGTLLHRQRAAEAAYEQAAAQYRSAFLKAFQNVADSLRALQQDANTLR